jgi:hypothetical protein
VFLSTGASATARLLAATDVTVGDIELTLGQVSITATGSILDADPLSSGANDADQDVTSASLRLNAGAGIGASVNHLETTVGTLSASAAGASGVFVLEANDLVVGDVTVTVNRVKTDGAVTGSTQTDALQSDVRTTGGNGSIVLRTTAGSIVLNDGTASADGTAVSAHGSGSVRIEAVAGSVTAQANADIRSGTGDITVRAGQSISLGGNADVMTASTGTVSLNAVAGTLTMDGTSNVTATGSSARLRAQGDITLGNVAATNVSVDSDGGSVINAANSTTNVTAAALRLQAQGGIGAASRHLSTSVGTLTALAATGAIYVTEADGVTVGDVAVTVREFNADATTTNVEDVAQSDLTTGANGNVVLVATLGDIVLNEGTATGTGLAVSAHGSGSVRLEAVAGSVTAGAAADVRSGTGDITVRAGQNVTLGQGTDIATAAPGTVSVRANSGALTMAGSASVSASGSSAVLWAAGDVTLGQVVATAAAVTSSAGALVNATGSTTNVTAQSLRLEAAGAVGTATRPITTSVDTLSASGAGVYVQEENGLTIDTVVVDVREFPASGGSPVTVPGTAQSGVSSSGDVGLVVSAGNLVLNDGADGDGAAVRGTGSGELSLSAPAGNVVVAASVLAGQGTVDIQAGTHLNVGAGATISGAGGVSLGADTGAVTMAGTSTVTAANGEVNVQAATTVTLGQVSASDVQVATESGQGVSASAPVQANQVVVSSLGPTQGSSDQPLRVTPVAGSDGSAARAEVYAPSGMVYRMKTWGGEVQFVVVVDGRPHVQLVSTSTAIQASGTSGLGGGGAGPLSASRALSMPGTRSASVAGGQSDWAASAGGRLSALQSATSADVRRLGSADVTWDGDVRVSAGGEVDADGLGRSFTLGLPAAQPWSAGALAGQSGDFNYWAETLTF